MISRQPALWNAISPLDSVSAFASHSFSDTYVLDDVTMIRDEQIRAHHRHVDLHTDQAISMAW